MVHDRSPRDVHPEIVTAVNWRDAHPDIATRSPRSSLDGAHTHRCTHPRIHAPANACRHTCTVIRVRTCTHTCEHVRPHLGAVRPRGWGWGCDWFNPAICDLLISSSREGGGSWLKPSTNFKWIFSASETGSSDMVHDRSPRDVHPEIATTVNWRDAHPDIATRSPRSSPEQRYIESSESHRQHRNVGLQ